MTEPVDAKYGGNKPIVSSGEKTKLNVEMAGVSWCLHDLWKQLRTRLLYEEPMTNILVPYGVKSAESFGSIKELNNHHRVDHGVVDLCDKKFATQTALDKHMYTHKDLCFVWQDCGLSFPFKSRLEQHRITHQADPGFMCQHRGCDHSFKNRGDLNRYLHSHNDVWYKCDSWPNKNKDKRNQDSHMRIHQEQGVGLERYHCEKCGKAMRFSTQLRHHKETGCDI